MGLWNSMFAGGIVRGPLFRANPSLAGHAALELASDFLRAALFQRVGACPHHEGERAEE
jgi:hypothetical protein